MDSFVAEEKSLIDNFAPSQTHVSSIWNSEGSTAIIYSFMLFYDTPF